MRWHAPVKTCLLTCWVPPGAHQEDVAGSCQVEGDPTSLQAHQKDGDVWVVGEGVYHRVPLLNTHAACQAH